MSRAAAFLDRDGTINVKAPPHEYVTSVEDLVLLPGAVEGAARLARAGFVLTVVSNQRGVARGLVTAETLTAIENSIQGELAEAGCRVEAFRYCPHNLDAGCDCRKPRPGMLLDLAQQLDLDLARSWMIGDSETDVAAGRAAGCHTALVAEQEVPGADVVEPSLERCADRIVSFGG